MSMYDKSYCATDCEDKNCERNMKYNCPTGIYTASCFDETNPDKMHKRCPWKLKYDFENALEKENHNLKEQLENFIPRRRVRRVYKMLGDILEEDTNTKEYVNTLKKFINKIEKEGKAEAGQEIKTAIEHLLSVRER